MPLLNRIRGWYQAAKERIDFWGKAYRIGIYLFGHSPRTADKVRYTGYAIRTGCMVGGLIVFTTAVISVNSLILPTWAFWAFGSISVVNASGIFLSMIGNHLRDSHYNEHIKLLQDTAHKDEEWLQAWRAQWTLKDRILKAFRLFSDVNGVTGTMLTIASAFVHSIVWLSLASRVSSVASCLLILSISPVRFYMLHKKLKTALVLSRNNEQAPVVSEQDSHIVMVNIEAKKGSANDNSRALHFAFNARERERVVAAVNNVTEIYQEQNIHHQHKRKKIRIAAPSLVVDGSSETVIVKPERIKNKRRTATQTIHYDFLTQKMQREQARREVGLTSDINVGARSSRRHTRRPSNQYGGK